MKKQFLKIIDFLIFIFSFLPSRCFSRVSYTISFYCWFVNGFSKFYLILS